MNFVLTFLLFITSISTFAQSYNGLFPAGSSNRQVVQQQSPQRQAPMVPYGLTSPQIEALTPQHRADTYQDYSAFDEHLLRHCTTSRTGVQNLDATCGEINSIAQGDTNFKPERIPRTYAAAKYADIPRNSKVSVQTRCDRDGKFRTRIFYTDINGVQQPFTSPWGGDAACLTSPGVYNRPNYNNNPEEYRTTLPTVPRAIPVTGRLTSWHRVSENQTYAGAIMPWVMWLNNSGFAFHAETNTTPADGYPGSAGCFRLPETCARGLFYLARRVGTDNINVGWYGYGHPETGQPCLRPSAVPNPAAVVHTQANSTAVRQQIRQQLPSWWRRNTNTAYPYNDYSVPNAPRANPSSN